MDFTIPEEHRPRIEAVSRFAREALSPGARGRRAEGRFDRGLWDRAGEFGLAGLPLPEEWGGGGLDPLGTAAVIEALGRSCEDAGLVFSLSAHMLACGVPVWRFGSPEQRERFLAGLAAGRLIGANALTEPEAGSDAFAIRTRARREGDTYVLDGAKCFVTNAPVADLILLYATTDPARGSFGITAFLLPRDAEGLKVTSGERKLGLPTSPWGDVYLDGCRIPASLRLGPEGAGAAIFQESMRWERGCLFAAFVGAMERTLERCLEHARTRVQFGRPIGHNQSVSDRLVDMRLRVETARWLLYRAVWLHARGEPCDEAIALSKLWISESAARSGLDAIQIFGGSGVVTETGVADLLLDALPARIFSGASEIQREIVARHMGLRR